MWLKPSRRKSKGSRTSVKLWSCFNKKSSKQSRRKTMKLPRSSTNRWKKWETKTTGDRTCPTNLQAIPPSFSENKKPSNKPMNRRKTNIKMLYLRFQVTKNNLRDKCNREDLHLRENNHNQKLLLSSKRLLRKDRWMIWMTVRSIMVVLNLKKTWVWRTDHSISKVAPTKCPTNSKIKRNKSKAANFNVWANKF